MVKRAQTLVPIHDLIAQRWSGRAYDANQPVESRLLIALLEAARWAPSCYGEEPWRYLVWDRFQDPDGWQKAYACLTEGNRLWVKNAPLLLLSIASPNFSKNGKPNRWAQHDTGAASENLCLQAAGMGLMAHQMGGFDAALASSQFEIPEKYTCMAMIAVGHPAQAAILEDEKLRAQEQAGRSRQPLGERFYAGSWGVPFKES
jgi:nitroreductase